MKGTSMYHDLGLYDYTLLAQRENIRQIAISVESGENAYDPRNPWPTICRALRITSVDIATADDADKVCMDLLGFTSGTLTWNWLFGYGWVSIDPAAEGLAFRLRYYIEKGIPPKTSMLWAGPNRTKVTTGWPRWDFDGDEGLDRTVRIIGVGLVLLAAFLFYLIIWG